MPGIVGIVSRKPAEVCEAEVKAMVAAMNHEIFYVSGTTYRPEMGIYAGWVGYEEAANSTEIQLDPLGDMVLLISGEYYIDYEMSAQLGHNENIEDSFANRFLQLYQAEGDQVFARLNGAFSGLLIDRRKARAVLFNDRYGLERVYCHETTDSFYFASEAKALLRVVPKLRSFDDEGVGQFLTYGCTIHGRTLFRGVELLPAGSLQCFEGEKRRRSTYFSPKIWEDQGPLSESVFQSTFQETFDRILPRYFGNETRMGISLTGGLDSRLIMASLPLTSQVPICYTFSGSDGQTIDDRLAAQVSSACQLEHQLLRLGDDFFSDFGSHADQAVYLTDGCLGATGAHEIYFNRLAREIAPVRLTGLFGSEILRGVSTFKQIDICPSLVRPEILGWLTLAERQFAAGSNHPITRAAFENIPWNLFGSVAAARSQVMVRTPYLDNNIVSLAFQIPETLRKSSRVALNLLETKNQQLRRIPTDRRVEDRDAGWRGRLRRAFAEATFKLDYIHNDGMPHWLSPLDRTLTAFASGFSALGRHKYLHYRSWFRREFAKYVTEVITDPLVRRMPFWNPGFVANMAQDHVSGRRNYVLELNAVLTLEAVERLLFRSSSAPYSDEVVRRMSEVRGQRAEDSGQKSNDRRQRSDRKTEKLTL